MPESENNSTNGDDTVKIMGTTIYWDQIKSFRVIKDVSIYLDKTIFNTKHDFTIGLLAPEDYEKMGPYYIRRGVTALAVDGIKHNGVWPMEYALMYVLNNNPQIKDYDSLIRAFNRMPVISREACQARNLGYNFGYNHGYWDIYYMPLSSGQKYHSIELMCKRLGSKTQPMSKDDLFKKLNNPMLRVSTMLSYEDVKIEEIKEKIIS